MRILLKEGLEEFYGLQGEVHTLIARQMSTPPRVQAGDQSMVTLARTLELRGLCIVITGFAEGLIPGQAYLDKIE